MEERIDTGAIHMESELICLDYENGEWTLKPGKAFQQLRKSGSGTLTSETSSSEQKVFVVAIIGDTGNGKTLITRELLSLDESDLCAPFTAAGCIEAPTSCNITCFKAVNITPLPTSTFLLDNEGEKSAQNPLLKFKLDLKQRAGWDSNYSDEEVIQRREHVERFFPQLAYAMSNVVILMSHDEFTACSYLERCIKMAKRAISSHKVHCKPVLICICNCARLNRSFDIDEVTKTFKKQAGFQELSNYFSDIICFRFPDKIISMTDQGVMVEGKDIFSKQIIELKKHLKRIHQEQCFRLLTLKAWLDLTEELMGKIPRGTAIHMSKLRYLILARNINAAEQSVLFLFRKLYSRNPEFHPRRWYHYCRRFAMKALARSYAMGLPPSCRISDEMREDCTLRLKVLWYHLHLHRPCEEIYFGLGHPKNKNHIVFCRKEESHHGACHRTSEVVYFPITKHWRLFQTSKHDTWEGPFHNQDSTSENPSPDTIDDFLKEIENATNEETVDACSTFYKLLSDHELLDLIRYLSSISHLPICCCCLNDANSLIAEANQQVMGTQARTTNRRKPFCSSCLHKLRQMDSRTNSTNYRKPLVPVDYDNCASCVTNKRHFAFYPCGHHGFCRECATKLKLQPAICPVCRNQIEKPIEILNIEGQFVSSNHNK